MQKVKKKVSKSAQSRVTCVVKADATGNGGGSSPCGGERSEKAPWSGNLRSPADAWEPGGGGEAPRGAAEASGNQDHIGGTTLGANLPQIEGFLLILQMFT